MSGYQLLRLPVPGELHPGEDGDPHWSSDWIDNAPNHPLALGEDYRLDTDFDRFYEIRITHVSPDRIFFVMIPEAKP